jgi:hypothetical protein
MHFLFSTVVARVSSKAFSTCPSLQARLVASCCAVVALGVVPLHAADSRVTSLSSVIPTFSGTPMNFFAGGRVGNWVEDPSGNQEIVFDGTPRSPANARAHRTDIFALSPSTYTATLISSNSWLSGDNSPVPRTGVYVGNAWLCPTSGVVSNTYLLFQAQDNASKLEDPAEPGSGYDNNIWLYIPSTNKIWRLTNFPISGVVNLLQQGVLGPQCSQDSDSNTHTLHIVFAHIIQGPPSAAQSIPGGLNCGNRASNGTCWNFGNWEMIYADVNLNSGGTPLKDPESPRVMPYLVHSSIKHVNPRNATALPVNDVTASGAIDPTSHILTPVGSPVLTASMVDAGIHLTGNSLDYFTSIQAYSAGPPATLTLENIPAAANVNFAIENYVYYEPTWYVSNLGDLYFGANQKPLFRGSLGSRWNETKQSLVDLTLGSPAAGDGAASVYANTWFNEFPTPAPAYGHIMFMSDRATAVANYSIAPEYSDHYLCSTPSCSNIVRLTYYNDGGPDALALGCTRVGGCSPVTATRGAWSPDGTKFITLVEFTTGLNNPLSRGILAIYGLQFPNAEISGAVTLSGSVSAGR